MYGVAQQPNASFRGSVGIYSTAHQCMGGTLESMTFFFLFFFSFLDSRTELLIFQTNPQFGFPLNLFMFF
jgi:hypothetical protein